MLYYNIQLTLLSILSFVSTKFSDLVALIAVVALPFTGSFSSLTNMIFEISAHL